MTRFLAVARLVLWGLASDAVEGVYWLRYPGLYRMEQWRGVGLVVDRMRLWLGRRYARARWALLRESDRRASPEELRADVDAFNAQTRKRQDDMSRRLDSLRPPP